MRAVSSLGDDISPLNGAGMKERAVKILNELFPERATEGPEDLTAHVYSKGHNDEIVVWLEGGAELSEDALWKAFEKARGALEKGGFESVDWKYRWKPRQAGGRFRLASD